MRQNKTSGVGRSKLWDVVKFEVVRNLKKPSFWVVALLLPGLMVAYIAWVGHAGTSIEQAINNQDFSDMKLGYADESGLVDPSAATEAKLDQIPTRDDGIAQVRDGQINIFYFVPADFSTGGKVEIFTNTGHSSIFANYEAPIRQVLAQSAATRVNPGDALAVTGAFQSSMTNFDSSGQTEDIMARAAIPLVALGLFYILILMFGNRLTMATVEEKENRITEMILTTISPTALVRGKIISLIALGLIQVLVLLIPVLAFVFISGNTDVIPIDITSHLAIDWNPLTIATSLLLLIMSYVLFTGASVAVGALVPTAKELAPYSSIFMMFTILPVFQLSSFFLPTPDAFVQFTTWFPLTSPVALMLRNAFGTLTPLELWGGIALLALWSALFIRLAAGIFKRSAMDFTSKISLAQLFGRE